LNDNSQSNPMLGARIVALVRENTFARNVWYGIVVGQRIDPSQRLIGYSFEGTSSGTDTRERIERGGVRRHRRSTAPGQNISATAAARRSRSMPRTILWRELTSTMTTRLSIATRTIT
jgi:hypothetical protein